jgi:hypothetical protein
MTTVKLIDTECSAQKQRHHHHTLLLLLLLLLLLWLCTDAVSLLLLLLAVQVQHTQLSCNITILSTSTGPDLFTPAGGYGMQQR